jgi:hypothetical protein
MQGLKPDLDTARSTKGYSATIIINHVHSDQGWYFLKKTRLGWFCHLSLFCTTYYLLCDQATIFMEGMCFHLCYLITSM